MSTSLCGLGRQKFGLEFYRRMGVYSSDRKGTRTPGGKPEHLVSNPDHYDHRVTLGVSPYLAEPLFSGDDETGLTSTLGLL